MHDVSAEPGDEFGGSAGGVADGGRAGGGDAGGAGLDGRDFCGDDGVSGAAGVVALWGRGLFAVRGGLDDPGRIGIAVGGFGEGGCDFAPGVGGERIFHGGNQSERLGVFDFVFAAVFEFGASDVSAGGDFARDDAGDRGGFARCLCECGRDHGPVDRVGRWCALGTDGAGDVDWGVRGFAPGGGDLRGGQKWWARMVGCLIGSNQR